MASRIRGWPVTIVAALLPSIGQAQVGTPTRARIDTVTQLPSAARPRQQPAGGRRICVDCGGGFRPERAPAYIIKDSAARVLAMIAPGDTNSAHPYRLIKPEAIASISVVLDSVAVRVLGRGFENGIMVLTLSPAGTIDWLRATKSALPR